MAVNEVIASGNTERNGTFSVAAGSEIVVFTDGNLLDLEHIKAERSYDGGTSWRPIPDAIVCDNDKKEGRIAGPITNGRLTITATAENRTVYIDS